MRLVKVSVCAELPQVIVAVWVARIVEPDMRLIVTGTLLQVRSVSLTET